MSIIVREIQAILVIQVKNINIWFSHEMSRRITFSSCFGRVLKYSLPPPRCLYRANSVGSRFTHKMLHLFAFQHLAHMSYNAPNSIPLIGLLVLMTFIHKNQRFHSFYTLLFHSLFKVEFNMDHFALGEHWERQ